MDWSKIRADFPAVSGQTYVNTASYGPPPRVVADAVRESVDEWSEGRVDFRQWELAGERARHGFASLIGASSEAIALVPTVAMAAGQVAERIERGDGRNIVVPRGEFRSNLYPWLIQARRGFEVRLVEWGEGEAPAPALTDAIDRDTALVAVSSVHSASGQRVDLERVGEACRRAGARLFVDATQAAGVWEHPLELVDYMGVGAYKWLLGPRGASFMYVRPELVEAMEPVFAGWRSPEARYDELYGPPLELAPWASRFDTGLAYLAWVGLARALEYLGAIGVEAVRERDIELAELFCERLAPLRLAPSFGPEQRSQIVSLRLRDPEATRERLAARDVVAAVRGPYLRVSFHLFNDETDVEAVIDALR